jgi:tetratricopeptide (TPR) repeat protein
LKELIESNGFEFEVREIYLKGRKNLLEMLLKWKETPENSIYFVHGIGNQFPWVLPYLNLHRDLFFDIKRPVIVVGNEYEIKEIQKQAPDWFRFRSRTYELKKEELGEEKGIMRLAELAESKPVYYPLPVFEEEGEEEIKERIKIDEFLLSSERDDYKLAELYMSLSLSHFKLDDFERGTEYMQKSKAIREKLEDNRGILLNYVRLSYIFIGRGEFEKAIDASNEALKIDPNLAECYISRGVAYAKSNRYDKAIEDFNKAVELNPLDAKAYSNRGTVYVEINEHERAIEDYNKAIELNPNFARVLYYNRGNVYAKINEHERAIEDYNKAIELNPNFAKVYYNRGNTYARLNEHERAIEDYSKAIELNPNDAEAYNNRGIAYYGLNQHERAIEDYSKAIELNPNDAEAYNNRGTAYCGLNEHERAIEDYSKAIELNPNLAGAYGNRGKAYSEIGRYEESARDFKRAGILFFDSGGVDDSVKTFSFCFELREEIENDDVIYCGLALFPITLNPDVIIALRGMQIQDETSRKIFELALMKLRDEDISGGIAMLEDKAKTEEMKILLELLKRL